MVFTSRARVPQPPATLVIKRPNKVEERFVRARAKPSGDPKPHGPNYMDEEYGLVMDCPPYTESFNNLLKEKRNKENPHRLVQLVCERMHAERIPMNTITYNLLMKRVVRYTDGTIFALYEALKAEGTKPSCSVRPDAETFRLLFRACERAADYSQAFLLYQQMRDLFRLLPDTPMFNTLLGYCAACRDVAQATYFVAEMKEHQVPLDVNTYNCLMSVLVDTAPCRETLQVFTELIDNGVQPTVRTFNIVLKAARISNDYNREFQLFEEMKRKGIIPDVTTYNTLFWMCQQRLDYILGRGECSHIYRSREQKLRGCASLSELVLLLLEEMLAMGIKPNTFTYNKVIAILLDCQNTRIFSIYAKVLDLYSSTKKQEQSKMWRSRSPRDGNTPMDEGAASDAAHHQAVEDALVADDPREDGRICAVGVHPNRRTYYLMMLACAQLGPMEKCKFLFDHMISHKVYPDKSMIVELLKVCKALKDVEWAVDLLEKAKKYNVLIDTEVFNHYLSVLAVSVGSRSENLIEEFHQMRLGINRYGAKADVETFNIVLEWFKQMNNIESGIDLFHRMRCGQEAVRPNTLTFCKVLELYSAKNDFESAVNIVKDYCRNYEMTALGKEFYHALMNQFAENDDSRLETLFRDIKEKHINPLLSVNNAENPLILDETFYAIILRYYAKHKRYDRMEEVFGELKMNPQLDITTEIYRSMFEMYHELKDVRNLIQQFNEARMNRVFFDVETYNIVYLALVEANDEFVFEVFRDMYESKMVTHESTLAIFVKNANGRAILHQALEKGLFYQKSPFDAF